MTVNKTRFFDENGNEIIREPAHLDDTEFVAEIGGELEESSVGVSFYSEKLDREEITRLIGIEPTKAWNAGELHPIGNGKKSRITDYGKWYFVSERDTTEINLKINNLLDRLTSNLDTWKMLTSKYETWIDVAAYMDNWNRGFILKPETMKKLADRNLEVVFDIYHYPDDEEEESENV